MTRHCVSIDGALVQFDHKPTEAEIEAWREVRASMQAHLDALPPPTPEQLAARARARIRVREYTETRDHTPRFE